MDSNVSGIIGLDAKVLLADGTHEFWMIGVSLGRRGRIKRADLFYQCD